MLDNNGSPENNSESVNTETLDDKSTHQNQENQGGFFRRMWNRVKIRSLTTTSNSHNQSKNTKVEAIGNASAQLAKKNDTFRSRSKFLALFHKSQKYDQSLFDKIEICLLEEDFGIELTEHLIATLKQSMCNYFASRDKNKDPLAFIRAQLIDLLKEIFHQAEDNKRHLYERITCVKEKPYIIVLVGVNGSGKTTTTAKLANIIHSSTGQSLALVAADTFRAAAVEQLCAWGEQFDIPVFTASKKQTDPAALTFSAIEKARQKDISCIIVDTAGRMHNKPHLMAELQKLMRVIDKCHYGAPHDIFLVLDGTIGQNTIKQVEIFAQNIPISGLIMTKLDGTARGGTLISSVWKTRIPVVAIGLGEKIDDILYFDADDFIHSLVDF